jgi:hypothetical protein
MTNLRWWPRRRREPSGGAVRWRQVLVVLGLGPLLAGCASSLTSRIDLPADTLRPEFVAEVEAGRLNPLRDYRLRYAIDGTEHLVEPAAISRTGTGREVRLSYRASQPVPPGSAVTASWTAAFRNEEQTASSGPVAVPVTPYDLDIERVGFWVDGVELPGQPSPVAFEQTDNPRTYSLPARTPITVRAIVRNNAGAVGTGRVRLAFPTIMNVPDQEQPLPEALGTGGRTEVVFDPVMLRPPGDLRYVSGSVLVDFGGGIDPNDTDPFNDFYTTPFVTDLRGGRS